MFKAFRKEKRKEKMRGVIIRRRQMEREGSGQDKVMPLSMTKCTQHGISEKIGTSDKNQWSLRMNSSEGCA